MNISFYVLSESKAQDFLGFICQLTQTALSKSNQSLLILIEDETLLTALDEALWGYEATSFIPHHCFLPADTDGDIINRAPVLLGRYIPAGFNGVILNTMHQPVNTLMSATNNARPTRVLELIRPDKDSVQEGRHKYKAYQQLGYELTHFKL